MNQKPSTINHTQVQKEKSKVRPDMVKTGRAPQAQKGLLSWAGQVRTCWGWR